MNNSEVIRSFLVSLGFEVDAHGQSRFEQSMASTGMQAAKLSAAVTGAAAAVLAFTTKIASGMDQLYFSSQRTGATVQGIQSIGYAASQTGSSAQAAQGAIESLARFVRNNPGGEGWINRLDVQTRNARGEMRDTADVFMDIGQRLQRMPYFQRNQFAQQLGIDEKTLIAMSHGMRQARSEYNQMARDIGYNGEEAAVKSHDFMQALRRLYSVTGLLSDKIGSDTAGSLTDTINHFSEELVQHTPDIERWAGYVVTAIGKIGEATAMVGDHIGDLKPLFNELKEDFSLLLGLDPTDWKKAWDLTDFNKQLGQATDTLNTMARIVKAVRTGNWKELADADRHLWSIGAPKDAGNSLDIGGSGISGQAMGSALAVALGSQRARDFVSGKYRDRDYQRPIVNLADSFKENVASKFSGIINNVRGKEILRSQVGLFAQLEQQYRLPAGLLHAVAYKESRGDPNAVSRTGAKGEFQFMPATAAQYGLRGDDVTDPTKSAHAAARYYSDLLKNYDGSLAKALAAYNWGPGNLKKYGYENRPRETRDYVDSITGMMGGSNYSPNTTVNVNVNGNGDGRQIGREVAIAVDGVNSRNSQVTGGRSR
ncbi:Membrane-bound lytic murein transglycosylase F [Carnimonas sp. R-84981]|uniref:lytic transglycosylase domain-containing protein n=1 Tax=Carnimonas bestiolae TaxID=3402172 RepID=UPI003EDBED1F